MITLCNSSHCDRSASCRRHPDSGTRPASRHAINDYSAHEWWQSAHCFGHLPTEPPPVQFGRRPMEPT